MQQAETNVRVTRLDQSYHIKLSEIYMHKRTNRRPYTFFSDKLLKQLDKRREVCCAKYTKENVIRNFFKGEHYNRDRMQDSTEGMTVNKNKMIEKE